jgi:hypothetical protein
MDQICTVCRKEKAEFSLALKREKGEWVVTPVGRRCRFGLIAEAKANGKFLPFYGLEASLCEAEKRNAQKATYRPFLEAFARNFEQKPVKKAELRVVSNG